MRISKVLFTLFFAPFVAQETEITKKTGITGDMEENRNEQINQPKKQKKSAIEEIIAKRNDFLKNLEVLS